jgi:RAP1 GTPase activating protein 1
LINKEKTQKMERKSKRGDEKKIGDNPAANGFNENFSQNSEKSIHELHQYIEDPEEISIDPDDPPLIFPEIGFRVELGGANEWEEDFKLELEDEDKHSPYYKNNYENYPHYNFIGGTENAPILVSIKQEEKLKKKFNWRVIIWEKIESHHVWIEASNKQKCIKSLKTQYHNLLGTVELQEVTKRHDQLVQDLIHMEDRLLIKAYKFGIVYCKAGQTDECDMFSNTDPSPEFEEFLNSIAKKTQLKGHTGYTGGLDVKTNTTGLNTYVTKYKQFEIMFHVSTCLPFTEQNRQQLLRKAHIGNDVVVIIFQDGPNGGFKPSTISSKFNHVYAVVQPRALGKGPMTKYNFAIVSKTGVRIHGPVLPPPPVVFPQGEEFRQFLLTKLINAERAAYFAPGFAQSRTRRLWLWELLEKYTDK